MQKFTALTVYATNTIGLQLAGYEDVDAEDMEELDETEVAQLKQQVEAVLTAAGFTHELTQTDTEFTCAHVAFYSEGLTVQLCEKLDIDYDTEELELYDDDDEEILIDKSAEYLQKFIV